MLDMKTVRQDPEKIRKMLQDRVVKFDLDLLLELDKKRREMIISTDELRKKKNDLMPDLPEDLNNIVTKAIGLQKHLKSNKGDNRNVRSLELIEAKIHRLSTHYKKKNQIPQNWKYKSVIAQLE